MTNRSTGLLLGLIVAASIIGCDSAAPDPYGFRSGSRLKARYLEGGGTKVFLAFHDTERDEDCNFGIGGHGLGAILGPGGVGYCLPIERPWDAGFADPSCTEKLVHTGEGTAPTVVVVEPEYSCSEFPTVFSIAEPYAGTLYGFDQDGKCASFGPAGSGVKRVGAEVPLERFVRAEETIESAGGRMSRVVLVSDDGARLTTTAYDDERSEPVLVSWASDPADARWTPRNLAYNYGEGSLGTPGTVYVDPGCTRPTGIKDAYDAFCPITAVYEFVPDGCHGYVGRFHEAGPILDTTSAFATAEDGSCVAVDATTPWSTYLVEMKAEIPIDSFAPVERTSVGEGTVTQEFWGVSGEPPVLPSGNLTNRASGEPCAFLEATDGTLRCMPTAWAPSFAYADPSCQIPIARETSSTDCEGVTVIQKVPPRVTFYEGETHPAIAYEAGASEPRDFIYQRQGDACASEAVGGALWQTLKPIDPETLPLATERLDP